MADIQDKEGVILQVSSCGAEGFESLSGFYDAFEPKGQFQGIPPEQNRARKIWLKQIVAGWHNFMILDSGRVIGHVAVAREGGSLRELIIFIHQEYRGRGIGTAALDHVKEWVGRGGGQRLWLTVQNTNIQAIRCFRKVGFEFHSPPLEPEREMILELENGHDR